MKLLVTGANGQLAHELIKQAQHQNISVVGLNRQQCQIHHANEVDAALEHHRPDVVVNCAAYTAVDAAESDQATALAVNCNGAGILAQACAKKHISLIHISTDYVFDGKKNKAYTETDTTSPINVYGDSKLQGECEIRQHLEHHIILRVSGVFGVKGHNFVKTMIKLGQERDTLRVVNDQISCPTPAYNIAEAILKILKTFNTNQQTWGTFHYCATPACTWFEFANAIFKHAKTFIPLKLKNLEAIPTSDFPTPAQRPAFSVLDCQKIDEIYGIKQPSWEVGLRYVIKELLT